VEEITRPLSKYKESTITPSLEYRRILTLGETSQEKLYFLSIFFLSLSQQELLVVVLLWFWDEWKCYKCIGIYRSETPTASMHVAYKQVRKQ
jgi:hypothetical protein